jgi:hypothetical protein
MNEPMNEQICGIGMKLTAGKTKLLEENPVPVSLCHKSGID